MENKTAEEIFCKVYTEFYGEPIDKAEQITEHRFNGNELMEFCEFYASQQKPEIAWLSEEENIQFLKQFTEGEHRTFANNVINSYQSELKTRIHPSQELSEKDKEIEEFAIGFAEWISSQNYKNHTSNGWSVVKRGAGSCDVKPTYSTEQLIELYKQSLNK